MKSNTQAIIMRGAAAAVLTSVAALVAIHVSSQGFRGPSLGVLPDEEAGGSQTTLEASGRGEESSRQAASAAETEESLTGRVAGSVRGGQVALLLECSWQVSALGGTAERRSVSYSFEPTFDGEGRALFPFPKWADHVVLVGWSDHAVLLGELRLSDEGQSRTGPEEVMLQIRELKGRPVRVKPEGAGSYAAASLVPSSLSDQVNVARIPARACPEGSELLLPCDAEEWSLAVSSPGHLEAAATLGGEGSVSVRLRRNQALVAVAPVGWSEGRVLCRPARTYELSGAGEPLWIDLRIPCTSHAVMNAMWHRNRVTFSVARDLGERLVVRVEDEEFGGAVIGVLEWDKGETWLQSAEGVRVSADGVPEAGRSVLEWQVHTSDLERPRFRGGLAVEWRPGELLVSQRIPAVLLQGELRATLTAGREMYRGVLSPVGAEVLTLHRESGGLQQTTKATVELVGDGRGLHALRIENAYSSNDRLVPVLGEPPWSVELSPGDLRIWGVTAGGSNCTSNGTLRWEGDRRKVKLWTEAECGKLEVDWQTTEDWAGSGRLGLIPIGAEGSPWRARVVWHAESGKGGAAGKEVQAACLTPNGPGQELVLPPGEYRWQFNPPVSSEWCIADVEGGPIPKSRRQQQISLRAGEKVRLTVRTEKSNE
jgi:hypothetical protein